MKKQTVNIYYDHSHVFISEGTRCLHSHHITLKHEACCNNLFVFTSQVHHLSPSYNPSQEETAFLLTPRRRKTIGSGCFPKSSFSGSSLCGNIRPTILYTLSAKKSSQEKHTANGSLYSTRKTHC